MSTNRYEDYPPVDDLVRPVPGYRYAMVLAGNLAKAQNEGWGMIPGVDAIEVQGPKGTVVLLLVAEGKRIDGGHADSWRPRVFVDTEADLVTGLRELAPSPNLPIKGIERVEAPAS